MGVPNSLENAVKHGRAALIGALGDTTPDAANKAKLYSFKKGVGANKVFGPLVGTALIVKIGAAGSDQLAVFKESDFANIMAPTLAEIVLALNAATTLCTWAAETGGHLSFEEDANGVASRVEIKRVADPKYGDALEVLGFLPSYCDLATWSLGAYLNIDEREPLMPLVQAHDFAPATNVYTAIASAPVLGYDEDTGLLTVVSTEAAIATVAATILG